LFSRGEGGIGSSGLRTPLTPLSLMFTPARCSHLGYGRGAGGEGALTPPGPLLPPVAIVLLV